MRHASHAAGEAASLCSQLAVLEEQRGRALVESERLKEEAAGTSARWDQAGVAGKRRGVGSEHWFTCLHAAWKRSTPASPHGAHYCHQGSQQKRAHFDISWLRAVDL